MKNRKNEKLFSSLFIFALITALAVLVFTDAAGKSEKETEKMSVAMGTVVLQKLYGKGDKTKESSDIVALIDSLENKISWRKENSVINTLNKTNSAKCDEEMKEIFEKSLAVYESSGGAFDITVGKLTTLWNIGEENARVPSKKEIKTALKYIGSSSLDFRNAEVLSKKGQLVDLGAVGKGLACDKVREYLENTDVSGAVISVGGSVLLYGKNGKSGWSVAVRDPRGKSEEYMGVLTLDSCCVSTSGDYERTLEHDGKTYHHIIDTKTGYPSESGLMSVTVVSQSGFMSDALSTACFVLGKEKGEKLLCEYGAEGVFIDKNKNVFVTGGLSDKFSLTSDKYKLSGEVR